MPVALGERPLAIGCMRLSTAADREETRALATLHAALDAGVTLLDTADAYGLDAGEAGHNERLIARALAGWPGDRSRVQVATKGGLTRPGGRWVADGRAAHLAAACAASRRALGVERIDLYQLHAPDPRVALSTSVRALEALRRDGLVERIGLCNVTLGQLQEARAIAEIASVQVELSPWRDEAIRNGLLEFCAAHGILLLAHRPLGGAERRARLGKDAALREVARSHEATPAEVALAWLRGLSEVVVPLPGPTRPETARSLARVRDLRLSDEDVAALDARFPAGLQTRAPRATRRPPASAAGEVVLVMGLPGAGKSTLAGELVGRGYARLNRDEAGGRLSDLLPALETRLAAGERRVVLDNTYGSRAARNAVIEAAWRHGVPVRCVWLQTSVEEAGVNVVSRMLARYGRLLDSDDLARAARRDPGLFAPGVLFRHRREQEPPEASEGFTRVEAVAFERRRPAGYDGRALIFWYEGVVRASRRGLRAPSSPDDVEIVAAGRDLVHRYAAEGWPVVGLAWHPEVARGERTAADVEATFARTHELLGLEIEHEWCPHGSGPPVCWCRKPIPGLGVVLVERHRLDPARCLYFGTDTTDEMFARTMGFTYRPEFTCRRVK